MYREKSIVALCCYVFILMTSSGHVLGGGKDLARFSLDKGYRIGLWEKKLLPMRMSDEKDQEKGVAQDDGADKVVRGKLFSPPLKITSMKKPPSHANSALDLAHLFSLAFISQNPDSYIKAFSPSDSQYAEWQFNFRQNRLSKLPLKKSRTIYIPIHVEGDGCGYLAVGFKMDPVEVYYVIPYEVSESSVYYISPRCEKTKTYEILQSNLLDEGWKISDGFRRLD